MRKFGLLCAVMSCFAGLAAAQDQPASAGPTTLALAGPSADASATPSPQTRRAPAFSKWQFATCYDYFRFRRVAGSAGLNGVNTSITYFVNETWGIEGDVAAAFGNVNPLLREKYAFYGGGPHLVLKRGNTLQPWVHGLFGGAHLNITQGIGPSAFNGFGVVGGGGVDILLTSHYAIRGQGDYVATRFGGSWQNSFQIKAGLVISF